jgi:hypothetical protein
MVTPSHDAMDVPSTSTRTTWIIVLSAVAALLTVAVVAARLVGSRSQDDAVVLSSTSTPPATASPTPSPEASPTASAVPTLDPVVEGALRRLGSVVQAAVWGRAEVGAVMSEVLSGCTLEPGVASRRLGDVISNREGALAQVSAFPVVGESGVDESAALLQSALNHSLHADRGYQRWVEDTYARYF